MYREAKHSVTYKGASLRIEYEVVLRRHILGALGRFPTSLLGNWERQLPQNSYSSPFDIAERERTDASSAAAYVLA